MTLIFQLLSGENRVFKYRVNKEGNDIGVGKIMRKIIYVLLAVVIISILQYYVLAQAAEQPLVSNVFYETDIRQALQDISAQVKMPIVIDPSVEGFINIELVNVPLEDALQMVLIPLGYTFKKVDNYYIVGLAKPESPVFDLLSKTEVIPLDYVKAEDLNKLVSDFFLPYIKPNPHNNSVTITAPKNIIERFRDDIAKIDRPQQQVMMEALVVELSEAGKKELGIRWGSMQDGGFIVSPPSNLTYNDFLSQTATDELQFSGTVTQSTMMTLKTMIQNGKAMVRANPRISALNGEEASIFIGKEEFFLINTGSQAYPYNTLQSIGTGVTLKITPSVSSSGAITVKIQPEVSEVTSRGVNNLPIVNKRTVSTTVRVFDGDTVVIGGLVQHNSSQTDTRAPFLGSIPLIGELFKSKDTSLEDKEVLIFITPHLSDVASMFSQYDARKINAGEKRFFERQNYNQASFAPASRRTVSQSMSVPDTYSYSSQGALSDQDYLTKKYIAYVTDIIDTADLNDLLASLYDYSVTNRDVVAQLTVNSSGYIKSVEIIRPSGSYLIDSTIKKAIFDSGPLPKFPQGLYRDALTMTMRFRLG